MERVRERREFEEREYVEAVGCVVGCVYMDLVGEFGWIWVDLGGSGGG